VAAQQVAVACLLGLAVALSAVPAHAQEDPSELSEAEREELGRLFSRARDAYEAENFREAIEALTRAYEIFPEPNILYRIGDAYENLGDLEPAIEHYRRYVTEAPDASDAGLISRRIEDLERRLESLRASVDDAPTEGAAFLIDTNPPGASVAIDGEVIDSATPVRLEVEPGAHSIALSLDQHIPLTREVVVEAGETISLVYQLEAEEVPPPPSGPGAAPWILGGAGLLSMGTGAVLLVGGLTAQNQVDEWDADREAAYDAGEPVPPRPADYDATKRRAVIWRNAAIITGGAGLLMVGGGVAWLALSPRPGDGAEVAVGFNF
jgi:tetratricopeptide (TPR) repeat protein